MNNPVSRQPSVAGSNVSRVQSERVRTLFSAYSEPTPAAYLTLLLNKQKKHTEHLSKILTSESQNPLNNAQLTSKTASSTQETPRTKESVESTPRVAASAQPTSINPVETKAVTSTQETPRTEESAESTPRVAASTQPTSINPVETKAVTSTQETPRTKESVESTPRVAASTQPTSVTAAIPTNQQLIINSCLLCRACLSKYSPSSPELASTVAALRSHLQQTLKHTQYENDIDAIIASFIPTTNTTIITIITIITSILKKKDQHSIARSIQQIIGGVTSPGSSQLPITANMLSILAQYISYKLKESSNLDSSSQARRPNMSDGQAVITLIRLTQCDDIFKKLYPDGNVSTFFAYIDSVLDKADKIYTAIEHPVTRELKNAPLAEELENDDLSQMCLASVILQPLVAHSDEVVALAEPETSIEAGILVPKNTLGLNHAFVVLPNGQLLIKPNIHSDNYKIDRTRVRAGGGRTVKLWGMLVSQNNALSDYAMLSSDDEEAVMPEVAAASAKEIVTVRRIVTFTSSATEREYKLLKGDPAKEFRPDTVLLYGGKLYYHPCNGTMTIANVSLEALGLTAAKYTGDDDIVQIQNFLVHNERHTSVQKELLLQIPRGGDKKPPRITKGERVSEGGTLKQIRMTNIATGEARDLYYDDYRGEELLDIIKKLICGQSATLEQTKVRITQKIVLDILDKFNPECFDIKPENILVVFMDKAGNETDDISLVDSVKVSFIDVKNPAATYVDLVQRRKLSELQKVENQWQEAKDRIATVEDICTELRSLRQTAPNKMTESIIQATFKKLSEISVATIPEILLSYHTGLYDGDNLNTSSFNLTYTGKDFKFERGKVTLVPESLKNAGQPITVKKGDVISFEHKGESYYLLALGENKYERLKFRTKNDLRLIYDEENFDFTPGADGTIELTEAKIKYATDKPITVERGEIISISAKRGFWRTMTKEVQEHHLIALGENKYKILNKETIKSEFEGGKHDIFLGCTRFEQDVLKLEKVRIANNGSGSTSVVNPGDVVHIVRNGTIHYFQALGDNQYKRLSCKKEKDPTQISENSNLDDFFDGLILHKTYARQIEEVNSLNMSITSSVERQKAAKSELERWEAELARDRSYGNGLITPPLGYHVAKENLSKADMQVEDKRRECKASILRCADFLTQHKNVLEMQYNTAQSKYTAVHEAYNYSLKSPQHRVTGLCCALFSLLNSHLITPEQNKAIIDQFMWNTGSDAEELQLPESWGQLFLADELQKAYRGELSLEDLMNVESLGDITADMPEKIATHLQLEAEYLKYQEDLDGRAALELYPAIKQHMLEEKCRLEKDYELLQLEITSLQTDSAASQALQDTAPAHKLSRTENYLDLLKNKNEELSALGREIENCPRKWGNIALSHQQKHQQAIKQYTKNDETENREKISLEETSTTLTIRSQMNKEKAEVLSKPIVESITSLQREKSDESDKIRIKENAIRELKKLDADRETQLKEHQFHTVDNNLRQKISQIDARKRTLCSEPSISAEIQNLRAASERNVDNYIKHMREQLQQEQQQQQDRRATLTKGLHNHIRLEAFKRQEEAKLNDDIDRLLNRDEQLRGLIGEKDLLTVTQKVFHTEYKGLSKAKLELEPEINQATAALKAMTTKQTLLEQEIASLQTKLIQIEISRLIADGDNKQAAELLINHDAANILKELPYNDVIRLLSEILKTSSAEQIAKLFAATIEHQACNWALAIYEHVKLSCIANHPDSVKHNTIPGELFTPELNAYMKENLTLQQIQQLYIKLHEIYTKESKMFHDGEIGCALSNIEIMTFHIYNDPRELGEKLKIDLNQGRITSNEIIELIIKRYYTDSQSPHNLGVALAAAGLKHEEIYEHIRDLYLPDSSNDGSYQ